MTDRTKIGDLPSPLSGSPPLGGKSRRSLAINTVAPVLSGTTILSLSTGTWSGSNGTYERRYFKNGSLIVGATAATYDATGQDGVFIGQVRTFDVNGVPTRWTNSNEVSIGVVTGDFWEWEDGNTILWEDGNEIEREVA